MELALTEGWTQVEPKDTPNCLLFSGQLREQKLLAFNTSFSRSRDFGSSGGASCPFVLDASEDRAYLSNGGIKMFDLGDANSHPFTVTQDLAPLWMLERIPDTSDLLMHLMGEDPKQNYIARLHLEDGSFDKHLLPTEAFFPLDVNHRNSTALYETQDGAAVYQLGGSVQTLASIRLPFHPIGGRFDADETKVVIGGNGLFGWHTDTGDLHRLCEIGMHPVFDRDGELWFSAKDGALGKLRGRDTGFEVVIELTGVDTHGVNSGSYAQPIVFSPDGRYGLARLTGRTKLSGKELEEAEAFCKKVNQPFSDLHSHKYHHYFCVLDLKVREVWCHEGYAHDLAWASRDLVP